MSHTLKWSSFWQLLTSFKVTPAHFLTLWRFGSHWLMMRNSNKCYAAFFFLAFLTDHRKFDSDVQLNDTQENDAEEWLESYDHDLFQSFSSSSSEPTTLICIPTLCFLKAWRAFIQEHGGLTCSRKLAKGKMMLKQISVNLWLLSTVAHHLVLILKGGFQPLDLFGARLETD